MFIPIGDDNQQRKRLPILTSGLILANIAAFIWQWLTGPSSTGYAMVPAELAAMKDLVGPVALRTADGTVGEFYLHRSPEPVIVTVITSMFLHGGILHIAGNMLFLWVCGDQLEDRLGRIRFMAFYLLCGVAAAIGHVITEWGSYIPTLGASGAISGILGGYLRRFATNRMTLLVLIIIFITTIKVPAWAVLGLWFGLQVLNQVSDSPDNVAYMAHIAGFVAGFILMGWWDPKRQMTAKVIKR